jgi:ribonuclease Z
MMQHLEQAFSFDIHVRRDLDEKIPGEGVKVAASEIRQGVVFQEGGVKVTAFVVDHGPVKPAFGYRVDYGGHSVVLSGDTSPSENLVEFAKGADLLIHEVGRWKQDPILAGRAEEILPNSRQTRGQVRTIAEHHTDAAEAGQIFERVRPKLAVFSHYRVASGPALDLVRKTYAGPVEFGEDMMTIEVGESVTVRRFRN